MYLTNFTSNPGFRNVKCQSYLILFSSRGGFKFTNKVLKIQVVKQNLHTLGGVIVPGVKLSCSWHQSVSPCFLFDLSLFWATTSLSSSSSYEHGGAVSRSSWDHLLLLLPAKTISQHAHHTLPHRPHVKYKYKY